MNNPVMKKPLQPLPLNDWLTGKLYGRQKRKERYLYCLRGDESLDSIARNLAGKQIKESEPYCYEKELDWKSLAYFNYGTTEPAEINWYLANFNGCRKTDSSGKNFIFSRNDSNPFLWVPVSNSVFVGKTGTTLRIVLDEPNAILNFWFESKNGERIESFAKDSTVFLVVEARDSIGNKVDIDLSDMDTTFAYQGKVLEDKILQDIEITSDRMRIALDVINGGT